MNESWSMYVDKLWKSRGAAVWSLVMKPERSVVTRSKFLFPIPMWSNWSSKPSKFSTGYRQKRTHCAVCVTATGDGSPEALTGASEAGVDGPTILPNARLVIW